MDRTLILPESLYTLLQVGAGGALVDGVIFPQGRYVLELDREAGALVEGDVVIQHINWRPIRSGYYEAPRMMNIELTWDQLQAAQGNPAPWEWGSTGLAINIKDFIPPDKFWQIVTFSWMWYPGANPTVGSRYAEIHVPEPIGGAKSARKWFELITPLNSDHIVSNGLVKNLAEGGSCWPTDPLLQAVALRDMTFSHEQAFTLLLHDTTDAVNAGPGIGFRLTLWYRELDPMF